MRKYGLQKFVVKKLDAQHSFEDSFFSDLFSPDPTSEKDLFLIMAWTEIVVLSLFGKIRTTLFCTSVSVTSILR